MNYQNAPVPNMPEVPTKASALASALEQLSSVVDVLEKRMEVVSHSAAPEPDTSAKSVGTPLCLMAENFYQSQRRVDGIAYRVQSLINRLEI